LFFVAGENGMHNSYVLGRWSGVCASMRGEDGTKVNAKGGKKVESDRKQYQRWSNDQENS
jgi:hypothetical protein